MQDKYFEMGLLLNFITGPTHFRRSRNYDYKKKAQKLDEAETITNYDYNKKAQNYYFNIFRPKKNKYNFLTFFVIKDF